MLQKIKDSSFLLIILFIKKLKIQYYVRILIFPIENLKYTFPFMTEKIILLLLEASGTIYIVYINMNEGTIYNKCCINSVSRNKHPIFLY